jgi:hypothetical protein
MTAFLAFRVLPSTAVNVSFTINVNDPYLVFVPMARKPSVVIAGPDPAIDLAKGLDPRVPQTSIRSLRKLDCFARA